MIADMHCHLDLYPDYIRVAQDASTQGIWILAVTTTPKAWHGTRERLNSFPNIQVAVGLHPELNPRVRFGLRVLEPAGHLGWTVQFGPYLVNLPSRGDMTFYERLANNGLSPTVQHTTYEYVGWPTTPTFGLLQNEAT